MVLATWETWALSSSCSCRCQPKNFLDGHVLLGGHIGAGQGDVTLACGHAHAAPTDSCVPVMVSLLPALSLRALLVPNGEPQVVNTACYQPSGQLTCSEAIHSMLCGISCGEATNSFSTFQARTGSISEPDGTNWSSPTSMMISMASRSPTE